MLINEATVFPLIEHRGLYFFKGPAEGTFKKIQKNRNPQIV